MLAGGRGGKMPCESCSVQFSVFKRKRVCCECERYYCSSCLRRGGGAMCAPCRVLSTRPLYRNTIAHLKVRDLQCFLQRQNVSTRGCVEKDELVNLCVMHVNGASYRRRGGGGGGGGGGGARGSGAFSSLKGLTNNINDFLNSAFDLRAAATPAPPPPPSQAHARTRDCYNASHAHRPAAQPGNAEPAPTSRLQPERFTTTPRGERDISVPVPAAAVARSPSAEGALLESADCFEIEDLDDAGWEFVTRPADPLPNDSDILISMADALRRDSNQQEQPPSESVHPADLRQPADTRRPADTGQPTDSRHPAGSRQSPQSEFERIPESQRNPRPTISRDYLTPGLAGGAGLAGARAASELELRSSASTGTDTASLKDELVDRDPDSCPASPCERRRVSLEQVRSAAELEALTVKQLKELLARNRVEYRGCLERRDLLDRAALLWRDHNLYRDEMDNLPIEECCKICMAAPLECVLLECGHIAACTACSKQLAECPICRQYVVRAVRFFRS